MTFWFHTVLFNYFILFLVVIGFIYFSVSYLLLLIIAVIFFCLSLSQLKSFCLKFYALNISTLLCLCLNMPILLFLGLLLLFKLLSLKIRYILQSFKNTFRKVFKGCFGFLLVHNTASQTSGFKLELFIVRLDSGVVPPLHGVLLVLRPSGGSPRREGLWLPSVLVGTAGLKWDVGTMGHLCLSVSLSVSI